LQQETTFQEEKEMDIMDGMDVMDRIKESKSTPFLHCPFSP